ncbi:ABC transporter substrate binding protein [Acidaminococcus sp.]|uniref:ABC transporter substrate binding protein n=1 Tax=Acidaminococcus sp. TaxID=1872103 RepID=UPI003522E35C
MEEMKLWKKGFLILTALAVGLTAGCGGTQKTGDKKNVKVGVVQLVEHQALDAANKGFVDGLAAGGFKEGENLTLDRQNAQADQSNLQTIAQRFANNKEDLICAIATPAAQTVANVTRDIPVVGTAITDYKEAKLVKDPEKPGTNVTGTTDMNPIDKQLDLLLKIVPKTRTIGILYNSSEINSQIQVKKMKELAEAKGLTVREATVSSVNDIQQSAQSLVGQVDAIYVPTDNVIASAMPVLAKITNPAKIPVICGEEGVVKSGALATIGIDYYKLGYQTGLMAAKILKGEAKPQTMPIEKQKDMKVTINETTAKELGITLPEDVLKGASLVK